MANEIQVWNIVLSKALEMPGVKIDREQFLKGKLGPYCTEGQVQTALMESPLKVLSRQDIDRIANSVISSHVKQVTTTSAVAGLPGGLTMAVTIPADIAQYYYHVFNLSQKLAYLYGYPDLLDENGNVTDDTVNLLTLFAGVMMGAAAANNAIRAISKQMAQTAVKRLPQKALTKGVIYPIVKQLASKLGHKINKEKYAKVIGKIIPYAGAVISGGLTYVTFRPAAKRLQKQLQGEMEFFYRSMNMTGSETLSQPEEKDFSPYEDVTEASEPKCFDYQRIVVLISIAHIDNAITEKERVYINTKIEEAEISDDEKFELINYLKEGKVPKISFDSFKDDKKEGVRILSESIELLKLDRRFTLGEKLYIRKIGKELGYTQEDLAEFIISFGTNFNKTLETT